MWKRPPEGGRSRTVPRQALYLHSISGPRETAGKGPFLAFGASRVEKSVQFRDYSPIGSRAGLANPFISPAGRGAVLTTRRGA
jgi:hypothetical protein